MADDAIDSAEIADGAVDLAHMSSESVDEDNLHISNSGSNGQFLSKQSGNSGGLTWATPTSSATALDDIAAGDAAANLYTTVGNITIDAQATDADVIIKVDDNGSSVTAVTFDGSDEGNAIFVNDVQLKSDGAVLEFGDGLDVSITHDGTTGGTITGKPMVYESQGSAILADNTHSGVVLEFLAGENVTLHQWVYISTTDGRVDVADANDSGHYPAIGVSVSSGTISAGNAVKILTHGVYNDSDGFGGDLTEGNVLYLSETAGGITATAPSDDGDRVQVCGIAIGPRDVFVNPSLDVIEHD